MNIFKYRLFKNTRTAIILGFGGIIFPYNVFAADTSVRQATFANSGSSSVHNFRELVVKISEIINSIIPLIISLTVLIFIFGVFRLVLAGDSTDARKEAKGTITFGIVSLFIMVSVWGLVNILKSTFFGGSGLIIPQLK